ncbi:hypothetical protein SAMN05216338_1003254 [Bradyrhizobium sp. Rc2d]|nr:hypothetical protein SAMN05216338_1003254 [Bradyrhizobium sp. Rc2d]
MCCPKAPASHLDARLFMTDKTTAKIAYPFFYSAALQATRQGFDGPDRGGMLAVERDCIPGAKPPSIKRELGWRMVTTRWICPPCP